MSAAPERDELVATARRLEALAGQGGDEFERLLAGFNAATAGDCTRATFLHLYQAEEPEDLVDRLLAYRDAPPFVPPSTREGLVALLERAERASDPARSAVEGERAGEALAGLSRLPHELARQLGSGFGTLACWPPRDEIIDFALSYEPAATKAELFELVRRWLRDADERRPSIYVAVGEPLLAERQAALGLDELRPVVRLLASGVEVNRAHALARLRRLVGVAPPVEVAAPAPARPAAPAPAGGRDGAGGEERVRHPTFGVGVVLRRDGDGPDAKVVVRFEAGDKVLVARFVAPCAPES